MVVSKEMLVEVGDQTAWEVHDAVLLVNGVWFSRRNEAGNLQRRSSSIFFQNLHNIHRELRKKHVPAEGQSARRIDLQ